MHIGGSHHPERHSVGCVWEAVTLCDCVRDDPDWGVSLGPPHITRGPSLSAASSPSPRLGLGKYTASVGWGGPRRKEPLDSGANRKK